MQIKNTEKNSNKQKKYCIKVKYGHFVTMM